MIGIIGFGRFGRLMARYLAADFPVRVFNRTDRSDPIRQAGAIPAPLGEVCQQKVVIVSVAISALQEILSTIAPFLPEGTVVVDVCSVKEYPARWMREILPPEVSLLPTHPMFGPDSAADSLAGRKIVLCRERIPEAAFQEIRDYLSAKGLVVIEATPAEHDRQIAVSLSLTHFIGRSLAEFGAQPLPIDTEGYRRLLHTLGVVTQDSWQLFLDMHRYNPYAAGERKRFVEAVAKLHRLLEGDGDPPE